MALRLTNPHWKSAVQSKAETHAPAVSAWLLANAANRYIGMVELRAGLPAIAADLTREVVNQICFILKLEVSGADDQGA